MFITTLMVITLIIQDILIHGIGIMYIDLGMLIIPFHIIRIVSFMQHLIEVFTHQ